MILVGDSDPNLLVICGSGSDSLVICGFGSDLMENTDQKKSELESDPPANTDPDPKFKGKCGIRSVTDPHKDYQCGSGFYKIRIRQGLNIHLRIFKQSVDNCRKKYVIFGSKSSFSGSD